MRSAFAPAEGIYGVKPLVQGLPAHLKAIAFHACTPCIDTQRELDATVNDSSGAQFVADVLPHLPQLSSVKLYLQQDDIQDWQFMKLMHGAVTPHRLSSFHLTLVRCSLTTVRVSALAALLARASKLQTLWISVACCDDPATASLLARQICHHPRLRKLALCGEHLVESAATALTRRLAGLTALHELHIEDDTLSHAHAASLSGAAGALPQLTSLHLGGLTREAAPSLRSADGPLFACQVAAAVGAAGSLRSLTIFERSHRFSGWCGLGAGMAAHAAGCAQLTRLALVRSVRCGDMAGLGLALPFMPALQVLNLVATSHELPCGGVDEHACECALRALLPGIAVLSQLTTLVLAGLDVPEHSVVEFSDTLAGLPALDELVLSDASHSGHSWGAAAAVLADAMASHFTRLRRLFLLSWRVEAATAAHLAEALGDLQGLTELKFAVTDQGSVDMHALAGSLQRLPGLSALYLRIPEVSVAGIVALAPGLQHLSGVTELQLQFEGLNTAMMYALSRALEYKPSARWNPPETAVQRAVRLAPGLQQLRVLDVSRCRLVDRAMLAQLTRAVRSLPGLQEVRVRTKEDVGQRVLKLWKVSVVADA